MLKFLRYWLFDQFLLWGGGGKGGAADNGAEQMRQQEAQRQQRIADATNAVNNQFAGFDDNYFSNIADAFLKFQQPLFDEQVAAARRRLPLNFATTDNSEYQRTLGEFERDVAREQAQLRDKSLDFANQQRGSVEENRAALVASANAGTDASALASQAASRAQALSKPPTFSPIADLFQKYTANAANVRAAANAGYLDPNAQTRPLTFQTTGNAYHSEG